MRRVIRDLEANTIPTYSAFNPSSTFRLQLHKPSNVPVVHLEDKQQSSVIGGVIYFRVTKLRACEKISLPLRAPLKPSSGVTDRPISSHVEIGAFPAPTHTLTDTPRCALALRVDLFARSESNRKKHQDSIEPLIFYSQSAVRALFSAE